MVHRRPITSYPVFAPLIALWMAALMGLTVAVLPAYAIERGLHAVGLDGLVPVTFLLRLIVGLAAAGLGALLGYAVARGIARRAGADPRPVHTEHDSDFEAPAEPRRRRPLHVREELEGGFGDESRVPARATIQAERARLDEDAFMILTPQPIHPPPPEPDLEALLEQFDSAFVAFCDSDRRQAEAGDLPASDPVQSFVARQMATPRGGTGTSPIGGLVPDHQAELRAALDKLARSQGTL